ncbi:uncharacterized protein Z519_11311 [Cladophialophora bantiana CBS 173.52]|uniref:Uncharacterized protein n=1 Tax=Cladophialophora bantiana (strain ATCC 10958 / CBS 173.52 / CDC B-1940 / NIH 8579) TaxID=1442370 RepID=A0A0D2HBA2_CLAB1|nr:uncharacterized protein Z519_11311 [Cladophialophora bantiana CBS 173.52]KIW88200.1 hypothetical protein Z519_11311 [Cladophialophora bantiana CBS 173.52]
MRIEIALDPTISPQKLVVTKAQIFSELEHVRESCEYSISLIWTLRMFEAVIARTHLSPTGTSPTEPSEGDENSTSINAPASNPNGQYRPAACSSNRLFEEDDEVDFNLPLTDDVFGILPVTENYDWLENLFGRGSNDITDPLGAV